MSWLHLQNESHSAVGSVVNVLLSDGCPDIALCIRDAHRRNKLLGPILLSDEIVDRCLPHSSILVHLDLAEKLWRALPWTVGIAPVIICKNQFHMSADVRYWALLWLRLHHDFINACHTGIGCILLRLLYEHANTTCQQHVSECRKSNVWRRKGCGDEAGRNPRPPVLVCRSFLGGKLLSLASRLSRFREVRLHVQHVWGD
mmetsp:Transcript_29151/g.67783  ORF Transcript_29151/g.67783 Transcript_29151/m.67783 type:complete len:201 (+) Transcript_29151:1051-1653(+)